MTESELERMALDRGGTVGKSVAEQLEPIRGLDITSLPKRHVTGRMNKTEAAYARHLDLLKTAGQVQGWFFECFRLRLADKTWLLPDFMVLDAEYGFAFHETKGFRRDDAMVKLKVAASMFSAFPFFLVTKTKSGWDLQRVSSR